MKITIVQREIEEAIRQYIHNQIAVKEGHEITMDFTSTRGDDGLIAAINIAPVSGNSGGPTSGSSEKVTQVEPVAETVAEPMKPRATRAARVVDPAPVAEPAEAQEEEVEEAAASDTSEEDESLVEGDKPLSAAPSIFASLRRPTNEAAEGTAA